MGGGCTARGLLAHSLLVHVVIAILGWKRGGGVTNPPGSLRFSNATDHKRLKNTNYFNGHMLAIKQQLSDLQNIYEYMCLLSNNDSDYFCVYM